MKKTIKSVSFWNPINQKKVNPGFTIFSPLSKPTSKNNSFQFGLPVPNKKNGLKTVSFMKPIGGNGTKKKNMTWDQAKIKYPKLNPYADADRDGVPNILDCRPFNKKKHLVVKYERGTPTRVKNTVSTFFKDNPKLKEQGENLGSKKIFWEFGTIREGSIAPHLGSSTGIQHVNFGNESGKPPKVQISSKLSEKEIPRRIKKALAFKEEVESRKNMPLIKKIEKTNDELPRLLTKQEFKGAYTEDILKNLKKEKSDLNDFRTSPDDGFAVDRKAGHDAAREAELDAVEEYDEQAPSQDIVEDMIESDEEETY